MASSHIKYLLRLPPSLRSFLRTPQPIPSLRSLSTRSIKSPPSPRASPSPLPKPPPPPHHPPFLRRFLPTLFWTALSLLTYFPIAAFFYDHIGRPMRVGGRSMYPFLNTDYATSLSEDRVWVDLRPPSRKTARRESGLKRGEVVVFWSPSNPEHMAVKRIIALEGDIVETRRPYPFREETVPWGHVWVEGEHPEGERASVDSNNYGPIPVALVIGKVKAVYWPWKKAGWVRWQDWKGSSRVREGKTMEPIEMYTF